jgi:tetratricopeptide (TPR) repeat protein
MGCATLDAKGIRCWIAPRDILPGMDWGEAIIEAINGSRVIVLVFSSNANDSQQIKREVERAVSKGLPIIPFRIENVAPARSLEYFIGPVHWLDALTPPLETHLQNLAETVRLLLARLERGKDGGAGDSSQTNSVTNGATPTIDAATAEQQRLNAEFARLQVSLAEQMARNALTDARDTAAAMLRLKPTDREALEANAVIGEYDKALADYEECLRLNPKYAWAFANRSETYRLRGDHDRAIGDYTVAIRLSPKHARAYRGRGVSYEKQGERVRVEADYTEANRLETTPSH